MTGLWRRFQLWRHQDFVHHAAAYGYTPHPDARIESWSMFRLRVLHCFPEIERETV